jgi:WD40 repeat protein
LRLDVARSAALRFQVSAKGWIAFPESDGTVRIRLLDGGGTRDIGRLRAGATDVAFSLDGNWLAAYEGGGALHVFNLAEGSARVLPSARPIARFLGMADDMRRLLAAGADGKVVEWALEPGKQREVCPTISPDAMIRVSHDARFVVATIPDAESAFSRMQPTVLLCDTSTDAARDLTGPTSSVRSLAFAHRAPLVAAGTDDGSIFVWDVSKGSTRKLEHHVEAVLALSFSRDDRLLASGVQTIR